MVDVQRANVILTISEEEVDKYMSKGFSVIDANGNVVKQSVPTELSQLQKAYSEHVATIQQLNSEIANLRAQLQALTAGETTPAAPKGVEGNEPKESKGLWDDWSDAEEADEKPKKRRKTRE